MDTLLNHPHKESESRLFGKRIISLTTERFQNGQLCFTLKQLDPFVQLEHTAKHSLEHFKSTTHSQARPAPGDILSIVQLLRIEVFAF